MEAPQHPRPVNDWCLVQWTDADHDPVKRLACHFDELAEVLDLRWPANAAAREPVTEYTGIPVRVTFYKRRPLPKLGEVFSEVINQGERTCQVVAVDEERCKYLYEYEMPGGRIFLRNQAGQPVARKSLSARWKHLIDEGCYSQY